MQRLVDESQKYKQNSDHSDKTMKHDVSSLIDDLKKSKAFYVDNEFPPLIEKLPKTKKKPAYWRRITDLTNNDFVKQKDVSVCVSFLYFHLSFFFCVNYLV